MENKKDLYVSWNESGTLKEWLGVISLLVKSGVSDKDIADYFKISVREFKELKKKYKNLDYATSPNNVSEMVECFKTLRNIAYGYTRKVPRKVAYKNKKGQDTYSVSEQEVYYPPNPSSVEYILDKFFGTQWRKDVEQLELQKKKLEAKKEEWTKDGNSDEGN